MNEFDRIARFFKPLAKDFPGSLNLTDDAAIMQVPPEVDLVVTTDAMVEGIHFSADDTPQSIAQRLLRSNLSDLAAMGAQPVSYTLITALNKDVQDHWLESFSQTLQADQKKYNIHLMGGDTVRTEGPKHFSITAFGVVPRGQAMKRTLRKNLGPHDVYEIYVSGTIGDSTLGLMAAQGKKLYGVNAEDIEFLKQRHFAPEPRLELGRTIRTFALACIDISDGLAADIGHMAVASMGQAIIESDKVPLSPAAKKALDAWPEHMEAILTGGEDYELAFVIDSRESSLLKIAATKLNVPMTKIGELKFGEGGIQILDADKRMMMLKQKGWQHF
ncbi:MAG: thiamine-phosphate kinase [Alphaproteobacteria bacterium]|nr:thiamine-phosphate kinase [Alphaproteobacteria bacterium]